MENSNVPFETSVLVIAMERLLSSSVSVPGTTLSATSLTLELGKIVLTVTPSAIFAASSFLEIKGVPLVRTGHH